MNGIWQGTKKNEMGESLPAQKIQKNRRGGRGAGGMGLGPKTFDSKRISRAQQGWLWAAGCKRRSSLLFAADEKSEMRGVLPRGVSNAVNLDSPWIEFPHYWAAA